jgi:hypothetical protein
MDQSSQVLLTFVHFSINYLDHMTIYCHVGAVSYEARAKGVKRGMRGGDATKLCPDIQLVQVCMMSIRLYD